MKSNEVLRLLLILKYAITSYKMKREKESLIILDNATIHYADKTTETLKRLMFNRKFLPADSPILTPVELYFRMDKNKLRANLKSKRLWFDKITDRIIIYESVKDFNFQDIKNMWIQFVRNWKQWILKFY